jgi:hypothetical protein
MTPNDDYSFEMSDHRLLWAHHPAPDPLALDGGTVERILDGLDPADVPPAYTTVARLLAAARRGPVPEELMGMEQAIAAFVTTQQLAPVPAPAPRSGWLLPKSAKAKASSAVAAGALALGGAMAAAATGSLPGAAQSVASDMLAKAGISVPGPNHHAGSHPAGRGASSGQGSSISNTAQNTPPPDKGPTVCAQASNGQCQATPHSGSGGPESGAPVATPNSGGTATANTASGGASNFGTSKANTASNGASAAGSANASNNHGGPGAAPASNGAPAAANHGATTAAKASGGASSSGATNAAHAGP